MRRSRPAVTQRSRVGRLMCRSPQTSARVSSGGVRSLGETAHMGSGPLIGQSIALGDCSRNPYSTLCGQAREVLRLGSYRAESGGRLVEVVAATALRPWIDRRLLTVSDRPAPARRVGGQLVRWDREEIRPDRAGLAAYELRGGERVPSLSAAWLWTIRGVWEKHGVLTAAAWCASCGTGCIDRRQSPRRIRQWCDQCVRRRHRPEWRQCPGCEEWFATTRGNAIYCSRDRCRKADRRRLA